MMGYIVVWPPINKHSDPKNMTQISMGQQL